MEGVYSAAKKQYHDNYLQYLITGQPQYQTAYEAADQSIQNTLAKLKQSVGESQAQVAQTFSSAAKSVPETRGFIRDIHGKYAKEHDAIEAAKLRLNPGQPSYTSYMVILGGLGAIAVTLQLLG